MNYFDTSNEDIQNKENTTEGWVKKIKDYGDSEIEKLTSSQMRSALECSLKIMSLEARIEALENVVSILTLEELPVNDLYIQKTSSLRDEKEQLLQKLPSLAAKAFETITQKELVFFIGKVKTFQENELNEYKFLVGHLSDKEKEIIYHALRSQPIEDVHDVQMIRHFEDQLGYSFDFALEQFMDKLQPKMMVFFDLFKTLLPSFDRKVKDTMRWIEEEAWFFNYNEEYLYDVAETIIRRFQIGTQIEDKDERLDHQKHAIAAFVKVMNENFKYSPQNKAKAK